MSINLSIRFSHPEAIAHLVRYRRIDLNPNSNYITVSPNPTTSPANIATNVPAGVYEVYSLPLYADGRECQPIYAYTPSCPGLLSINAYISGNNLVVEYLAPFDVPKVKINVFYPNGGSFTHNYINNGNPVVIPFPSNVYGDFGVTGQSVCDESSQFYSDQSNSVVVTRVQNNTFITNNLTGVDLVTVTGIAGFTLPAIVTTGNTQSGTHGAFLGPIAVTFTGTPSSGNSATLFKNGTPIQCVAVPVTSGGTINFSSASFADTDLINISFSPGICP